MFLSKKTPPLIVINTLCSGPLLWSNSPHSFFRLWAFRLSLLRLGLNLNHYIIADFFIDLKLMEGQTPKIQVVIRKRPLTRKEEMKGDTDIIDMNMGQDLIVRETK